MRKLIVLCFLLTSWNLAAGGAENKPGGVQEFTSLEELAVALSSYFPKMEGEVNAVDGDRVVLSLGRKQELIPGTMLTLWRDGKEILHPVTHAVLGRTEDEVGTVEVVGVTETAVTAVMRKKQREPKAGDKARITPKKINVALLPLREDHPEIVQTLIERLNEFGRFNVVEAAKVEVFVRNSKLSDAEVVKELGKAFGLDAVITVGVYPSESRLMTTARIFYAENAGQLDTVVAMLDLKPGNQALGDTAPFFTPGKDDNTITPELPFQAQSFVTADFDGDGRIEYVFSDGARLHIYRNEPSGWREVWTEIVAAGNLRTTLEWQEQAVVTQESSLRHINLESGDINANGKQEIFVTAMLDGKVFSSVFEFEDGSYRRTAELPGFLRVVSYPGKGTILLGQGYDPVGFYAGQPKQYTWSRDRYVPGAEVLLPRGVALYGWSFADLGESRPLLVALDDDDYLLVYSGETPVWKSAEQYTAVDRFVYKPVSGIEGVLSRKPDQDDKSRRVRLRGRVLAADVNGDGREEIILPKNVSGGFLGGFSGAELNALTWTGSRLDPAWSIKDIPGPVLDIRFMRQDRSMVLISALARTKGGIFTKDRQQVMIYSVR